MLHTGSNKQSHVQNRPYGLLSKEDVSSFNPVCSVPRATDLLRLALSVSSLSGLLDDFANTNFQFNTTQVTEMIKYDAKAE